MFDDLVVIRDRAYGLLSEQRRAGDVRTLLFVAGLAGGMLAHASIDLGDRRSAAEQARVAARLAAEAGHHGLLAWVLGTQSLIAYCLRQPERAVEYALRGQRYGGRGTGQVRLSALKARAFAAQGNASAACQALARLIHGDEPGVWKVRTPVRLVVRQGTVLCMKIRMATPLGVQEARERLPQILAGFTQRTGSGPVVVGAYRRPQGVIMSVEEYEDLLAAREERDRARAAAEALASVRAEGGEPSTGFLGDLQDAVAGHLGDDELTERAIARHRHV